MNSKEIYKLWLSKVNDHRYLRPKRWTEIENAINKHNPKKVLEFGAGVSTLLFSNLGLNLTSLETDKEYTNFVKSICPNKVKFIHWDGSTVPINTKFDLILIDGILPRLPQLLYAISNTNLIAIDDFAGSIKNSFLPYLKEFKRTNSETFMAIYYKDN
jgi:predicted O-methyltransferase YrrM